MNGAVTARSGATISGVDDPRAMLAREPMHRRQVIAVAIATALNALDGFDVLSISFASPGIAASWGVTRAALGVVLSMELIGMAIGSLALGAIADRAGRRPMILVSLGIMATGMAAAAFAGNIVMLSALRLLTGLGIGGMLAATNAVAAECANARRRSLAVAIMAGGYPVGAVVGGTIASLLLAATGRWQIIFLFGAALTAAFVPLVLWLVPETIAFLCTRQPRNALARMNRIFRQQGRAPLDRLPPREERAGAPRLAELFGGEVRLVTLVLTLAYFCHIMTFYFVMKWVPKIVADMGYSAGAAGSVLVWANVGGACGSVALSLLTQRVAVRTLVIAAMIGGGVAVALFGEGPASLAALSVAALAAGFFTNGATAGLYALIAQSFPVRLRGSGTGLVIGVGRGGAALGPIVAGLLFAAQWPLAAVAGTMALGTVLGAVTLVYLGERSAAGVA